MIGSGWSIRGRLFAAYAISLAACSVLIAAIVYIGVRYVPDYQFTRVIQGDPSKGQEYVAASPVTAPSSGGLLVVGTAEQLWSVVLIAVLIAVVVVVALGLAVGWTVSRRVLAPLHSIAEAAERAAAGDLSSRIDATGPHDELRRFADTFDETLARLERSFGAYRRFAANASHELRTPLATTKGLLELLPDASAAERAEIERLLEDANDRNILLVNQLLVLARAENETPELSEIVDLGEVVDDVLDGIAADAVAAELVVGRRIAAASVLGERTMLALAVRNLVSNAVAYNVTGGTVQVDVGDTEGGVRVVVENDGPAVAPTALARLTEPFYRVRGRTHDEGHHGLGLALVAAVVEAHGGTLDLTARDGGGLRAEILLPARD